MIDWVIHGRGLWLVAKPCVFRGQIRKLESGRSVGLKRVWNGFKSSLASGQECSLHHPWLLIAPSAAHWLPAPAC